jgi:hypothetical protein
MSSYYDLEQILRLQGVMGSDPAAIVASLLRSMTEAMGALEDAVAAGHLDRATQAAHRGRNDALVLGARPLLKALTDLEAAGRDHDEARVADALVHVRAAWAPTRDELAGAFKLP